MQNKSHTSWSHKNADLYLQQLKLSVWRKPQSSEAKMIQDEKPEKKNKQKVWGVTIITTFTDEFY